MVDGFDYNYWFRENVPSCKNAGTFNILQLSGINIDIYLWFRQWIVFDEVVRECNYFRVYFRGIISQ